MKRIVFALFLFFSLPVFAQNIPPRPNPPRLVNDFAHVLTPDQLQTLENKLVAYDDSTSTQIVIVTIPTIGESDISDYARGILRDWGVGNQKTNNGIVIVAAINDRDIRIETGYGMEGAIPDITAKAIIENHILPHFRTGNFYRGFDEGLNAIFSAAAGEYKAPEGYHEKSQSLRRGTPFPFIILVIIIIMFLSRRGGGGGGMMSRRGFNPFLGGFLGGMLANRGGGGWSGGGGGWSGGGGGGFGGFGGGSGGGGGASGSW